MNARAMWMSLLVAAVAVTVLGCRSVDQDELRTLVADELDARLLESGVETDISLALDEDTVDLPALRQEIEGMTVALAELRNALYGPEGEVSGEEAVLESIDSKLSEVEFALFGRSIPPVLSSREMDLMTRFSNVELQVADIQVRVADIERQLLALSEQFEATEDAAAKAARAECRLEQIKLYGTYNGC